MSIKMQNPFLGSWWRITDEGPIVAAEKAHERSSLSAKGRGLLLHQAHLLVKYSRVDFNRSDWLTAVFGVMMISKYATIAARMSILQDALNSLPNLTAFPGQPRAVPYYPPKHLEPKEGDATQLQRTRTYAVRNTATLLNMFANSCELNWNIQVYRKGQTAIRFDLESLNVYLVEASHTEISEKSLELFLDAFAGTVSDMRKEESINSQAFLNLSTTGPFEAKIDAPKPRAVKRSDGGRKSTPVRNPGDYPVIIRWDHARAWLTKKAEDTLPRTVSVHPNMLVHDLLTSQTASYTMSWRKALAKSWPPKSFISWCLNADRPGYADASVDERWLGQEPIISCSFQDLSKDVYLDLQLKVEEYLETILSIASTKQKRPIQSTRTANRFLANTRLEYWCKAQEHDNSDSQWYAPERSLRPRKHFGLAPFLRDQHAQYTYIAASIVDNDLTGHLGKCMVCGKYYIRDKLVSSNASCWGETYGEQCKKQFKHGNRMALERAKRYLGST